MPCSIDSLMAHIQHVLSHNSELHNNRLPDAEIILSDAFSLIGPFLRQWESERNRRLEESESRGIMARQELQLQQMEMNGQREAEVSLLQEQLNGARREIEELTAHQYELKSLMEAQVVS